MATPADRESFTGELHLSGRRIIGFVGRLRHEKGLHLLIDAMPTVMAADPDDVRVIVGDEPDRELL